MSEDTFPSECSLEEAQLYFPTIQHTMQQTGVPDSLVGERIKLGRYKGCYPCQSKDCEYVAQTRGVLCTHIRRVNLGVTLGCRFCPEKCWWQARYWVEHMDIVHPDAHKFQSSILGPSPVVSSLMLIYLSTKKLMLFPHLAPIP